MFAKVCVCVRGTETPVSFGAGKVPGKVQLLDCQLFEVDSILSSPMKDGVTREQLPMRGTKKLENLGGPGPDDAPALLSLVELPESL